MYFKYQSTMSSVNQDKFNLPFCEWLTTALMWKGEERSIKEERQIYFRFKSEWHIPSFSCEKHSQKTNQIDTNSQIATINTGSPLCEKSLARVQKTIKLD